MPKKRDNVVYELFDKGNNKVYIGITNDVDRRKQEHEQDKNFSSMRTVSPKLTEESARNREKERIETFQKNHNGKLPKYNNQL
jgi:GIY-YIG catalytic domain.